jgi:hypothetical protein
MIFGQSNACYAANTRNNARDGTTDREVEKIWRHANVRDVQMHRCTDGKMTRWECASLEQSRQHNPLECNHFHFTMKARVERK